MTRIGSSRLVAAVAMAIVGAWALSGCGGGGGGAVVTGGSIVGTTIDAATGLGLGNVQISVVTTSGVRSALSTTPLGQFTIKGVPAGRYTLLTVTPDATLYGAPRTVAVDLVVTEGGTTSLSGPILILDDDPPSPA
jgi:hypothetical protein